MTAIATKAQLYTDGGSSFVANPVAFRFGDYVCSAPPCVMELVLQNSVPVALSSLNGVALEQFYTKCALGDNSTYRYVCKDGHVVNTTCSGADGTVAGQCPHTQYDSQCNSLLGQPPSVSDDGNSGYGSSNGTCRVKAVTDTNITCACEIVSVTYDAYGVAVPPSTAASTAGRSSTIDVDYVAMLHAMTTSFVSTFSSAAVLSPSLLGRSWKVLATMGTLSLLVIFALVASNYLDEKSDSQGKTRKRMNSWSLSGKLSRRSYASEDDVSGRKGYDDNDNNNGSSISKSARMLMPIIPVASRSDGSRKKQQRQVRLGMQAMLGAKSKSDIAVIEESIPRILGSQSLSSKFADELKHHHRWFAIIFYYSASFPRALRVISLVTNIVIMLFIQSITYNLTNPDDGSCNALTTETACLKPQSPYSTGDPKCFWQPDQTVEPQYWNAANDSAKGTCSFVTPDSSIKIVLFVALFSALVSTPIALSIDWVIQNVLAAPVETTTTTGDPQLSTDANAAGAGTAAVVVSGGSGGGNRPVLAPPGGRLRATIEKQSSLTSSTIAGMAAHWKLEQLSNEIKKHRVTLSQAQRDEFDGRR